MRMDETLGVPAHRGGLVVERPELSVGIVGAVSRPTGLTLDLLARRPLDRRSATERQAGIRARRDAVQPAPRRLLPPYDEGLDLRVGWLDGSGRAHWEFGSRSTSSGDHAGGTHGPSVRTRLRFPPMYEHASLVLAWPEIGFPEAVVELALPDRATVERDTVSIWDAPPLPGHAPVGLRHSVGTGPFEDPAVEAGRAVAEPRVLSRGDGAVVVLNRLSAVGSLLSLELLSVATGARARAVVEAAVPPAGTGGPGASVAVIRGDEAVWSRMRSGGAGGAGGDRAAFGSRTEFLLPAPAADVLHLLVGWPDAGLPDVRVAIPLG
jgi:hypothetical protein